MKRKYIGLMIFILVIISLIISSVGAYDDSVTFTLTGSQALESRWVVQTIQVPGLVKDNIEGSSGIVTIKSIAKVDPNTNGVSSNVFASGIFESYTYVSNVFSRTAYVKPFFASQCYYTCGDDPTPIGNIYPWLNGVWWFDSMTKELKCPYSYSIGGTSNITYKFKWNCIYEMYGVTLPLLKYELPHPVPPGWLPNADIDANVYAIGDYFVYWGYAEDLTTPNLYYAFLHLNDDLFKDTQFRPCVIGTLGYAERACEIQVVLSGIAGITSDSNGKITNVVDYGYNVTVSNATIPPLERRTRESGGDIPPGGPPHANETERTPEYESWSINIVMMNLVSTVFSFLLIIYYIFCFGVITFFFITLIPNVYQKLTKLVKKATSLKFTKGGGRYEENE